MIVNRHRLRTTVGARSIGFHPATRIAQVTRRDTFVKCVSRDGAPLVHSGHVHLAGYRNLERSDCAVQILQEAMLLGGTVEVDTGDLTARVDGNHPSPNTARYANHNVRIRMGWIPEKGLTYASDIGIYRHLPGIVNAHNADQAGRAWRIEQGVTAVSILDVTVFMGGVIDERSRHLPACIDTCEE